MEGIMPGNLTTRANPDFRIAAGEQTMAGQLESIHPGEVLLEDFLLPMGISQNGLARAIDVPPRRIAS
jgi:hypothetical protein